MIHLLEEVLLIVNQQLSITLWMETPNSQNSDEYEFFIAVNVRVAFKPGKRRKEEKG